MTTEIVNTQQLTEELKAIRADLDYIKEHMVDVDTILSLKEEEKLDEAVKEYKTGKAVSLEIFEKEMDYKNV
jgi:hypothetical protein